MQKKLQITEKNLTLTTEQKDRISELAAKLDRHFDRITGCHVTVEKPHKHKHNGESYDVRIDVTAPGKELIVNRESNPDLAIAMRDAFNAMTRQVDDYAAKLKREVKSHSQAKPVANEEEPDSED